MSSAPSFPLLSRLRSAANRPVHNFHALPWSGRVPVRDPLLVSAYAELADRGLRTWDVSFGRDLLDSPFEPSGPLAEAYALAARAFGTDSTTFVSMGASCANTIAVGAAADFGPRTLVDSTAHQSIHFACDLFGLEVSRVPGVAAGSGVADVDCAIERLRAAADASRPFHTLILGSSTYGGLRLQTPQLLRRVHDVSPMTNIVFDDAWSALHMFHPQTAISSPTEAASRLRLSGEFTADIWVVHSAHKTMCAMRQGAYLHTIGPSAVEPTRNSAHRHHTSSPSWPVMASLDLARAHALLEGADRVRDAMQHRANIERWLYERGYSDPAAPLGPSPWFYRDELRVRIPIEESPAAIRMQLLQEHGVYLPQQSGPDLLANITIGIDDEAVGAFLAGLSSLGVSPRKDVNVPSGTDRHAPVSASSADEYLIAYPPGIPLAFPECWHAERLSVSGDFATASLHRVRRAAG